MNALEERINLRLPKTAVLNVFLLRQHPHLVQVVQLIVKVIILENIVVKMKVCWIVLVNLWSPTIYIRELSILGWSCIIILPYYLNIQACIFLNRCLCTRNMVHNWITTLYWLWCWFLWNFLRINFLSKMFRKQLNDQGRKYPFLWLLW